MEAYKDNAYNPEEDILAPKVFKKMVVGALGPWCYIHFGLPCSSWSRRNINLNQGTRTVAEPWGNNSLPRDLHGNKISRKVIRLVHISHAKNSWWSIENPTSSLVWATKPMIALTKRCGVQKVSFCQCMHGLKFSK